MVTFQRFMQFLFCCKVLDFNYVTHYPAVQYIVRLPLPDYCSRLVHWCVRLVSLEM